jgi:hypothetical protein
VGLDHNKEFTWTISLVSHKTHTTKKWCSGKQHSLVLLGLWFKPMPWQIVFATFHDLASTDLAKMITCGTLQNLMTTWNTLFSKNAYMWDPNVFYDDLEHFIFFKKYLYVGSKLVYFFWRLSSGYNCSICSWSKLVYDATAELIAWQNKDGTGKGRLQ